MERGGFGVESEHHFAPQALREARYAVHDRSGMMHRAELRPAHRAEFRTFEILGRQGLVVILASAFRIQAQAELFVPVKRISGPRERVVSIARSTPATRNVGRVGRDLVRDDPLTDILGIRETEMLFGSYITQHVGTIPPDHRRSDSAGDMVVSR